jgi:dipeptidyl aminopeptidase/acylaminoacyl peptidase
LYGNWGLEDVEDVLEAAAALDEWYLADPRRLVLYGSSAGGFTLLNAMIKSPGRFAAGLCLYPVTDLLNFPDLDFKLEKHYHEALLGKLPEAAETYRQRSPLFHAAQLRDPLVLFHGLDDPVVPVEQSRQIAAALQARGSPCVLRLYAGEGHGFRQPETIADMYATMEAFLREHLHLEDQ